ncbi:hypothetical protein NW762_010978 [Fusarium torreyae]|uniref:Aminoglycoside phosphotransferase n=1 Tax=Fusarium torreyae TaxID=1237075 RepID=A0A9W8V9R1_9HYPO|nr:hypothetical protein NW762_010978 [Fusarium torreyae]
MTTAEVLPSLPQDITAQWLSPKISVKNAMIQVKKIITGTATLVLISAMPEDGSQPISVCVKGGFNPTMLSQFPFILSLYTREVDFYNNLAPRVPHLNVPRKLWAEKSADNAVVIMEDICAASFVFSDPVETWPVHRVKKVVEQFAALHAATWGVEAASVP